MADMMEANSIIKIIRNILSDLNKLKDEQLTALITGTAKFKYFSADELKASSSSKKNVGISKEKMDKIANFLEKCNNKKEAEKYIIKQKLTVLNLKELAKHIDIILDSSKTKKGEIIASLVQGTVGNRLEFASIQRV